MNKRGLFFKIFFIVIMIIVLAGVIAGIYFYNYYVFKTLVVCIPAAGTDTLLPCTSNDFCLNTAKTNITSFQQLSAKLETAPIFLKDKINEIYSKIIVCETTCKLKQPYGDAFGNKPANFQGCKQGEEQINLEIHGNDAIALLKFAKSNPDLLK